MQSCDVSFDLCHKVLNKIGQRLSLSTILVLYKY